MKTWFVTLEFGIGGCRGYDLVEADTVDEAYIEAYEKCIEWAESYGYEQNQDYFGDLDSVGREWDEEEECYCEEGFLDPGVVEYNPERHDGYL